MTKNTSTPRNPPGSHDELAWYTITAATATPRRPSRPGRYGTRLIAWRGGSHSSGRVAGSTNRLLRRGGRRAEPEVGVDLAAGGAAVERVQVQTRRTALEQLRAQRAGDLDADAADLVGVVDPV